jgi:hypothetical protein
MSPRDKLRKAADGINDALEIEQEFEGPARGLVALWRRLKAWRARRKAKKR